MPTDSTNPTWIEPPPKKGGMGCVGRGCVFSALAGVLVVLLFVLGSYLFVSHGLVSKTPAKVPVKPLPQEELNQLNERIDTFRSSAPPVPSYTPVPGASATATPPETTATPSAVGNENELTLNAADINGLIAANPKSRGHAFVSLSGNTAHVQLSIPSGKIPGLPSGYLNGSFVITTNGPTPIGSLQVSRIETNGYPVPSSALFTTYRGQSVLGMAMEEAARYHVSTVEIRNGVVVLR